MYCAGLGVGWGYKAAAAKNGWDELVKDDLQIINSTINNNQPDIQSKQQTN
jgi:hypothetical protein